MGSGLSWEDVACPLCGARREQVLIIARAFNDPEGPLHRVVRCQSCGLGYLNPRPTEATIGALYKDDYVPYRLRRPAAPGLRERLERIAQGKRLGDPCAGPAPWHEQALAWLLERWLVPGRDSQTGVPYTGQGRLLDYGCGAGWFLHRMARRGWRVQGLEMNARVARQVSQELGLPVQSGSLGQAGLAPGSFDVVNLGAVLEHVHDPHAVIAEAARLLAPGGRLVVSVPNLGSAAFRWFGEGWFPLDLPYHLLHFTEGTLRELVGRHGLEVEQCRQVGRTSWMRQSLRSARRGAWLARLVRRGPMPGWLTRYTVWRGQADSLLLWARKPAQAAVARPLAA